MFLWERSYAHIRVICISGVILGAGRCYIWQQCRLIKASYVISCKRNIHRIIHSIQNVSFNHIFLNIGITNIAPKPKKLIPIFSILINRNTLMIKDIVPIINRFNLHPDKLFKYFIL